MIGTTCAQLAQIFRPLGTSKDQGILVIGVMRDHALIGRHDPTKRGKNLGGDGAAIGKRCMLLSAKKRPTLRLMLQDELAHLIDGADAVQIAFPLCCAPGKQTMAAKQYPFTARVVPYDLLQLKS